MREATNTAELSEHVALANEAPTLTALRRESHAACASMHQAVSQLEGYLKIGGPEAVKSLRGTVKKLTTELEQEKGRAQVQRYRALQQDLKQRDAVCDALRGLLNSHCNLGDAAVNEWLDKRVLKLDCLYGASREHLLRENKTLRSALESSLITTKTSAPAPYQDVLQKQPGGLVTNGTKDSRKLVEGAHQLAALMHAAERLRAAEKRHQPAAVRSASTQADDGSHSTICNLESRVNLLAAQKAQLMQKVSEVQSALALSERRAEAAESEAAEACRQKTDIMFHQGDMSAEIRRHLAAETARADKAEISVSEARHDMQVARDAASAARAEASILQTVLVDKDAQVQRLTEQQESMKEALLAAMDGLTRAHTQQQAEQQATAGSVADEVKAANRATEQQLSGAISLLQGVCKAAADSTTQASSLAAQQRELVDKFGGEQEVASKAMAALEAQLSHAQGMADKSDRERQRLQHQIIASSLLGRHQDRRHDEALKSLRRVQALPSAHPQLTAEQTAAPARVPQLSGQGSQAAVGAPQAQLQEVAAVAAAAIRGGVGGSAGGGLGLGAGLNYYPGVGNVGGRHSALGMGGVAGPRGVSRATHPMRVSSGGGSQAPRVSGGQVELALEAPRATIARGTPYALAPHTPQPPSHPGAAAAHAHMGAGQPASNAQGAYITEEVPDLSNAHLTQVGEGGGAYSSSFSGGHVRAPHQVPEDASAAVLQRSAALRVALEVLASSPHSVPS